MFSSTGYIGLPIVLTVFGEAALVPGIIGAVITGAVFLPLGIVLAELDRGRARRGAALASLFRVLCSPGAPGDRGRARGFCQRARGSGGPGRVLRTAGRGLHPLRALRRRPLRGRCSVKGEAGEIAWLVCAKLLLHPLITWWLAYQFSPWRGSCRPWR